MLDALAEELTQAWRDFPALQLVGYDVDAPIRLTGLSIDPPRLRRWARDDHRSAAHRR